MSFLDLSIIYLACGAPIAAEYALRSNDATSIKTICYVVLRLLVWPVFGTELMLRKFTASFSKEGNLSSNSAVVATIKDDLESALIFSSKTTAIFEYRELFDRYTGLQLTTADDEIDTGVSHLLALEAHPNVELAKACVQRMNRQRLAKHRESAAGEFKGFIDLQFDSEDSLIRQYASKAAQIVGDTSTAQYLLQRQNLENSFPQSKTAPQAFATK